MGGCTASCNAQNPRTSARGHHWCRYSALLLVGSWLACCCAAGSDWGCGGARWLVPKASETGKPIRRTDAICRRTGAVGDGDCGWWLVAGGWWLVAGGWWLVAGGWWLVAGRLAGGWWLVAGGWSIGWSIGGWLGGNWLVDWLVSW